MNPNNIVQCLADLVKADLHIKPRDVSQNEREAAQHLAETIGMFTDCKRFTYDEETTLDFESQTDDYEESDDEEAAHGDGNVASADDELKEDEDKDLEPHHLKQYTLQFMKRVVEFADVKDSTGKRRRSWKTVHNRFRTLPNQSYVSRFRHYLEHQGTKRQKLYDIDHELFKKFENARERCLPVHELDIQRWALKLARELKLEGFHASRHWLSNWKSRYSIVGRKITNIVTKHEIENFETIEKYKKEFLNEFYHVAKYYEEAEIMNTDQVGVEKEQHSTRTLEFQGTKKVYGVVRSKNATTHSYTLQPTISLDGKLVGPILLCLQEPTGKMGETVKKHLFEPKNVVITCSKSGKLTSSLVTYWLEKCFLPSIGKNTLLLSDSWPGQNDQKLYKDASSTRKNIRRIQIPQHTTDEIQPLDRYFNHQLKNFVKALYHHVALDEIDCNLYERNNIIRLVSLVHNQLGAPVFQKMILYSWFAAGYTKTDPTPFLNFNQVCFIHETTHVTCATSQCPESVFITCSHCRKKLCFQHFFLDFHFHDIY